MTSFKAVIMILKTLVDVFQWLSGAIDDHELHKNLAESKAWVVKATTGTLPERLEGGKDAENSFNDHAPKP